MVKKADSQKTKEDSNECDQKVAEIRRNAQLLKAQKRKKVILFTYSDFIQNRQNKQLSRQEMLKLEEEELKAEILDNPTTAEVIVPL